MPALGTEILKPTPLLAVGLMLVIIMMVLPVPGWVIDIGLTLSFAFAILIFATAIFIEKPLDFSSFPSVLLASLILRLSLNVSSTKLIIAEGHTGTEAAGGVIEGFAMFIMGGNLFVGLVVFAVLVIVNFMVITKGAGRMAEVGARFALDAMPGKQLAIDSDLAVGAISHEEAKLRRQREQEEASFLGSLDGASKFVKGDAIAGLLITVLNLFAGMTFGVAIHGLSFAEAASNYSILTVGDGLVSQIPAVIVSVSAALLLSKGRDEGAIDLALADQLAGNAIALYIVSAILAVFALFPGLPFLPFILASAAFAVSATLARRKEQKIGEATGSDVPTVSGSPNRIGDAIYADEIHLQVAPDLVNLILLGEQGFESRIDKIRRFIAEEYGFVLPPIRMTDNPALAANSYDILFQGVRLETGYLRPGHVLVLIEDSELPHLSGEKVKEPVYQASARWLAANHRPELVAAGCPVIEPIEALATHLLEAVQSNFALVFNRTVMLDTLDALTDISDTERAQANRRFFDDYIPGKVSPELLLSVLRLLLEERVSIRNLTLIVEVLAEVRTYNLDLHRTVETVRQRLAFQIVDGLQDKDGRLPMVKLSPEWEKIFTEHEIANASGGTDIALSPDQFSSLINAVQVRLNEAARQGISASVVVSARRRRFVKTILSSKGLRSAVLAFEEIGARTRPYIVGVA